MKKITSVFLVVIMGFMMLTSNMNIVKAEESFYDENGNYYNPNTGEYFRWENSVSRGQTDKSFSFYIRNYVTSSGFKLTGKSVEIKIDNASFKTYAGDTNYCCDSHRYEVSIYRSSSVFPTYNTAVFYAPNWGSSKSLGGGFSTTETYKLEVRNIAGLSGSNNYLVGSGTVYSN